MGISTIFMLLMIAEVDVYHVFHKLHVNHGMDHKW